jgi:hypothetical protein
MFLDRNLPLVDVTLCSAESSNLHVTSVPLATVRLPGAKEKFLTVTVAPDAPAAAVLSDDPGPGLLPPQAVSRPTVATAARTRLIR